MKERIQSIIFLGFMILFIQFVFSAPFSVGVTVKGHGLDVDLNLGEGVNKDINEDNESDVYVKLEQILEDNAFILLSEDDSIQESEMAHVILGVGEEMEADINGDGYNDVSVRLVYLNDEGAEVFIEGITEPVFSPEIEGESGSWRWVWIVAGVVLIIIIGIKVGRKF